MYYLPLVIGGVVKAAVLGASGYGGGETVRLLDAHPAFEVAFVGAHSKAGMTLGEVHPQLGQPGRVLSSHDQLPDDVSVAFLALPHGASMHLAKDLVAKGIRVVDMGSDYRMDTDSRYQLAYGEAHAYPSDLAEWTYGLAEWVDVAGADKVAVPGCYPTATTNPLIPLAAAGLIDSSLIVVNAMTGVSGAGRKLAEPFLFGNVADGVSAYAVGRHRHRPEIEMGLELFAGVEASVTFTPHLVPMQRGILATCVAPAAEGVTDSNLQEALHAAFDSKPFVRVVEGSPQSRWAVGSNNVFVSATFDHHSGMVIAQGAIDNLLKGTAGQAVQLANVMFGLEETTGLPQSGLMP
jgi:N-acetyl-gamma-glutamyl-phosphate reductase